MIKRLLSSLIVLTLFSLFLTNHQTAFAQTTHREYSLHILYLEGYILIPTAPTRIPTVTVTPAPTATPTTPASAVTQTPTLAPVVTQTVVIPTPVKLTPTPILPATDVSDVTTYIMNGINNYRASLGLSKVTTSAQTCDFATTRAKEISTSFSHDGFTSRLNNKTIPYTTLTKITENLATTPHYTDVVNLWINSPEHAANMRADTPYVCVKQYGNYYAYEGMKP